MPIIEQKLQPPCPRAIKYEKCLADHPYETLLSYCEDKAITIDELPKALNIEGYCLAVESGKPVPKLFWGCTPLLLTILKEICGSYKFWLARYMLYDVQGTMNMLMSQAYLECFADEDYLLAESLEEYAR